MKVLRKFLVVLLVLILILVAAAIALPIIYKKDIVRYIKEDLNQRLNADIEFDEDISIQLFNNFPKLSLKVKDISIVGQAPFASDTLFSADEIKMTIDLGQLIRNHRVAVDYLSIVSPSIHLITKDFANNWEIGEPDTSTESNVVFSTGFEKIQIQNGRFGYLDSLSNIEMDITGITGSFKGELTEDNFDLTSLFSCETAFLSYDHIPYINHIPLTIDAITKINLIDDVYQFQENSIWVGSMLLTGNGGLRFTENDDIDFDLEYASKNAEFKELLSLIPAYYTSMLEDVNSSGNVSVHGSLKGLLSDTSFPAYDFYMNLSEGTVSHQSLTNSFNQVNVDLAVVNPDGKDNSLVVNLKKLGFIHNNEKVEANILLKSIYSDPYAEGQLKGKVQLEDIGKLVFTDDATQMSGELLCDLSFAGHYSSIENEDYGKFKSSGSIEAGNIKYITTDMPTLEVAKTEIDFTSTQMSMPILSGSLGKSDFLVNGDFDNFFGYLLNNEDLTGKMTISSNVFDVNEFMQSPDDELDTSANLIVDVPGNLEVDLVYDFEELIFDGYTFYHLIGNSKIVDKTFNINQLTTNFLGGQVSFNGFYNTIDLTKPLTEMNITVQDIDIASAFKIKTVKLLAPIAEYASGKFSSTFHLRTSLLKDFSPDVKNMTVQGVLDIFNCDLQGLKAFTTLADKLNYDAYKEPINIKDLLLSFSIKDGKVEVSPFDLPIGETSFNLGGYSTLAKSLHFKGLLTIPKHLYVNNVNSLSGYIPKNQLGQMDSIDFKNLELAVEILGDFSNPKVNLAYKTMTQNIKDNVKSRAREEVDKRKEELRKQAKKELDKAKEIARAAQQEAERKAREALAEQKRKVDEQIAKEKEAAHKEIEDALKKKRDELLKGGFPPIKK